MKARSKFLLDHSIGCALSAIEIYNKPSFKEREQVFAVLMVTAWESLLKAKILKNNRNRLSSLYVRSGQRYKKNRSGKYLTIDLLAATRQCSLNPVALENIERLVEIRDAAIHMTAESPSLPYLVYSLGLASLRNYSKLLRDWFGTTLDEYDLFILPLGFSYPFRAITSAELRKEPIDVASIIRQVTRAQAEHRDEDAGYHLAFEMRTTLVSARKLSGTPDIVAAVDPRATSAIIVEKKTRLVDNYPLSFSEMWDRVKSEVPGLKQREMFDVVRDLDIRNDPKYSAYNWRNKAEELRGPGQNTPVIYNEDAVRIIVGEIKRRRTRA